MNATTLNSKMNKKIKKNIIIISIVMIFIHLLGLIYQVLSNSNTLSFLLKGLFIIIFISQIILIKLEIKYTKYICYGLNLALIVISAIYMDFASVAISVLLILYIYNLYPKFTYADNIENNMQNNKTKNTLTNKTSNKKVRKNNVKRDVN